MLRVSAEEGSFWEKAHEACRPFDWQLTLLITAPWGTDSREQLLLQTPLELLLCPKRRCQLQRGVHFPHFCRPCLQKPDTRVLRRSAEPRRLHPAGPGVRMAARSAEGLKRVSGGEQIPKRLCRVQLIWMLMCVCGGGVKSQSLGGRGVYFSRERSQCKLIKARGRAWSRFWASQSADACSCVWNLNMSLVQTLHPHLQPHPFLPPFLALSAPPIIMLFPFFPPDLWK